MDVIKELVKKEGYYNFYLKEDNKVLSIIFGGNLDLYWIFYESSKEDINLSLEESKRIEFNKEEYTFKITKENFFIYSLFEELYNDIKESKIFIPRTKVVSENGEELSSEEDEFTFWGNQDELKKQNENYKELSAYQMLFDGTKIKWHSDGDIYDRANRVIIEKVDDTFELKFIRPTITNKNYIYRFPESISIRFRNSGSSYEPYNIIFMRMFNRLQEYNPKYHQIHFEELLHQKKLSLKK